MTAYLASYVRADAVTVTRFDTRTEALIAAGGTSRRTVCQVAESAAQLAAELDGPGIVALYNSTRPAAPVTRFESRLAGAKRVMARFAEVAVDPTPEPEVPPVPTQESSVTTDATTPTTGRRRRYAANQRVRLLATENPKKAGKLNHGRFGAMMAACEARPDRTITVKEALEAGATLGDLEFDSEKGYLEVLEAE